MQLSHWLFLRGLSTLPREFAVGSPKFLKQEQKQAVEALVSGCDVVASADIGSVIDEYECFGDFALKQ